MKKFILSILLLATTIASAQSSYKNSFEAFIYQLSGSWFALDRYMQTCLDDRSQCGLDSKEMRILRRIQEIYPEEVKRTQLIADSATENPGRFNMGGSPRIAVTDSKPFSPIYLNLDLCVDKKTGNFISRKTGIAFLVHELGHHLGIGDTEERVLDKIGEAVARKVDSMAEEINLGSEGAKHLGAYVFNQSKFEDLKNLKDKKLRFPLIKIDTGVRARLMEDVLLQRLVETFRPQCPTATSVQAVYVNNVRWYQTPARGSRDDISILMDMKALCGSSLASAKLVKGYFIYFAPLTELNGQVIMDYVKGNGEVLDSRTFESDGKAQIKSFTTNTQRISPAGVWSGKALIEYKNPVPLKGCAVLFKGSHFIKMPSGEPFSVQAMKCKLRQVSESQFEVEFEEKFTSAVRSSDYTISSVVLIPTQKILPPIFVQPPRRLSVKLSNNSEAPEFVQVKIYDKNMRDLTETGIDKLPRNDELLLAFWIKGYSIEEIINFELRFSGVDRNGKAIHGHDILQDENGLPLHPTSLTRQDGYTLYGIKFKVPFRGVKLFKLDTIQIIDSNFHVIDVEFPKTFEVRY